MESLQDLCSSLLGRSIRSDELALLNQSLRIKANSQSGHFILLSASDNPIFLGNGTTYNDFSPYRDVQLFSESIEFKGDLLSPHGISISCNHITSTKAASINASGANGTDQIIGVAGAQPGDNGGHINFYVQSGSSQISQNVSFTASGGAGGDVHEAGAVGGNGGNGGTIIRIFQSYYSGLLELARHFLSVYEGTEEDMNIPVRKNDPTYLSAARLLAAASKTKVTETKLIERIGALSTLLSDIEKGIPSKVVDLVIKVRFIRNSLQEITDQQKDRFSISAHSRGGYGGSGNGIGKTGANGKDGTVTDYFMGTYNRDIKKSPFAYAHPEQCAMLLEQAKILYYMGSPELCTRAETTLQRLVDRLGFLRNEVYTESDLSTLKSIKTNASNMLIQLASGMVRILYLVCSVLLLIESIKKLEL